MSNYIAGIVWYGHGGQPLRHTQMNLLGVTIRSMDDLRTAIAYQFEHREEFTFDELTTKDNFFVDFLCKVDD